MKSRMKDEYVQVDDLEWAPFPDAFSKGGIRWKFLHASPELAIWAGVFHCPAGSSIAMHIHGGHGDYFLTKGRMKHTRRQGRRRRDGDRSGLWPRGGQCPPRQHQFPGGHRVLHDVHGPAGVHQSRWQPDRSGWLGRSAGGLGSFPFRQEGCLSHRP
jgi:hypothetical protein